MGIHSVLDNPYRTLGLLVGTTSREQERQVKRLKQFIEAEQEPEDDFSFPTLGPMIRNSDSVSESVSKLNLDNDKISAALFWFYKGNTITDEPAFDAIKEGDLKSAIKIWEKLIINGDITQRNASAYSNLGTLHLCEIAQIAYPARLITEEWMIRRTAALKLKFLESDYVGDFKTLATDENFKISKKDLQLIFLNQLQSEIEERGITDKEFLDILVDIDFSAKDEYFKSIIKKPLEQIERAIESAKNEREKNRKDAVKTGLNLCNTTQADFIQIKSIVGTNDIRLSSIADKLADEILQCSIDYFNESMDSNSTEDYAEKAITLANKAKSVALGAIIKDRINDNIATMESMKDSELSRAIELLQSIKNAYENKKAKITAEVKAMPLGFNQTINWDKVNKMIEKSLDWDKVVEFILDVIPAKNIDKIKNTTNTSDLNQYKELVNFVFGKLSFSQINKVKYICYWKTENAVSNAQLTVSSLPDWAKWCLGIAIFLVVVGLIWGEDGIATVFGFAAIFGMLFLIGWMRGQ
jgi:hypothetical protein